ncbi:MAG: tetratricopeptide repeat protein [bacterium]
MTEYYDLGTHHRKVSTDHPEAQTWFDRGLVWIYGFDLEMGKRCFKQAIALDDSCAMFYWGLAYSCGYYYNKPWSRMQKDELIESLQSTYHATREALARVGTATPVEAALIRALAARYQSPKPVEDQDYHHWDDDYAAQMRMVYENYSSDNDVCAIYAEGLMTRTPWALWELRSGKPAQGASTLEAIEVLESAMKRIEETGATPHPGILHMYIHVMEMSPTPERALRACDALRTLVPGAGHLGHMPSHIDIRCGNYYDAVEANTRAIEADRVYLQKEGAMNFHTLSRIHNYHFKLYAALFLGQFKTALEAAEELEATTPEALLRIESPAMADWMEAYIGMQAHVYIRFGKWQEIIDHPLPDDAELYCVTTAIWHYAKTVAYAASGEVPLAESQRELFYAAVKKVPETRYLFNNTCLDVLKVAEQMLNGEVEYRKQNYARAFEYLRAAVMLDDSLKYDEPWAWMQPARHALGALLLEQDQVEEAKQVYMADLGLSDTLVSTSQHPDNLWSLHGYVECLERLGQAAEAKQMRVRLNKAKARADIAVEASCFCRLQHTCCGVD